MFRAVAVHESWWRMSTVGNGGLSFGLTQIKRTSAPGTFPLSRDSTAFNADYYGATVRYYFDGCGTWLDQVQPGSGYRAGDLWGSVGAWYAGRWYQNTSGYLSEVKRHLAARTWERSDF